MFKKKILPIILFILLLLGMSYFPYLPIKIFNINYDTLSQNMKIIFTLICDIVYIFIIFLLYRKVVINDFKKYIKDIKNNFNVSFKYYLIGLIIMNVSNLLIGFIFSDATANNEEAIKSLIDLYPAYMIFSVAIYAPIVEEIIFRKNIRDCVTGYGNNKFFKYLYVIISGFIFATLHVLGMTNSYLDYIYIIPYLSLSIAFSLLYWDTNNIFSTITMHSMHNLVAFILYIFQGVFL